MANTEPRPFLLFEILHGGDFLQNSPGSSNWKILSIQAVLSFVFGNLTLLYPSLTLAAFITLFASFTMISGSITISQAVLVIANAIRDYLTYLIYSDSRTRTQTQTHQDSLESDASHIDSISSDAPSFNSPPPPHFDEHSHILDTAIDLPGAVIDSDGPASPPSPSPGNPITESRRQEIAQELFNLVEGFIAISVGTCSLLWPEITAMLALYLVAAWALITGSGMLAQSGLEASSVKYYAILGGFARLFLGIMLYVITPAQGVLAILWAVGIQAIVNGFLYAAAAIHCRIRDYPTQPIIAEETTPLLSNQQQNS